jgi:hypothetical protein
VDAQFLHTFADRLAVSQIPGLDPAQLNPNARLGSVVSEPAEAARR